MNNVLVRLAARNTLRRRARTLFTTGMVVFGVAILMVGLAWIRGVFGAMINAAAATSGHVRLVDKDFAAREELQPLYENIEDTAPLIALLERQTGVISVEPRINAGVTVTVGEEIGDVFGIAVGASERYFRDRLGAKDKLIAGEWFTGAPDEVVTGSKVAQQVGAKLGDEIVLLGTTQDGSLSPIKGKVVGIVGGDAMLRRQILVPLEKMRWLTDIPNGATEILVYAGEHGDAAALARSLRALKDLEAYSVQSWDEREPWVSLQASVRGVQNVIVFIFVFLTALGIWNTMMMSVLERTHEIGVLRAMGLTRLGAVGLFVGEALAIGVAGGIAGVLLGTWPAWFLETRGLHLGERVTGNMTVAAPETVYADLSLEIAVTAFGLGLFMSLLGSVLPAWRASSIQPVTAMRSGR